MYILIIILYYYTMLYEREADGRDWAAPGCDQTGSHIIML